MRSGKQIGKQTELFVFPLPRTVFYPGTTKPLNIFEPRYIQMINDSLEQDTPIALAFAEPHRLSEGATDSLGLRRVAGAGKPVVLDARSDGSMLILLEAIGKVRLGRRIRGNEPYLKCQGEWIEEMNRLEDENVFILNRLNKEFVRWLEANVGDREQLNLFLGQLKSPFEKINYLCSLMIHDAETQQRLLETDDVNDRLRVVSLLMDQDRESLQI